MSKQRQHLRKAARKPSAQETPSSAENLPEPEGDTPKGFAFIMTCMNRKDHVSQSAAALLRDPRIDGKHNHFILVDFYCPERTGEAIQRQYKDRVHVIDFAKHQPLKTTQKALFSKPLALNSGALDALHMFNSQYLVFLDADTIVSRDLLNFVFYHASPDRFMIFEPNHEEKRDLTGFLVVHRRPFTRVNGYDLAFKGWGAEDLDLRAKLYFKGHAPYDRPRDILKNPSLGMPWTELPLFMAESIPHTDERRTDNYEEKDKDVSHTKNLHVLCKNIFDWLGCHPIDLQNSPLGTRLQRLLGMDLIINPKSFE